MSPERRHPAHPSVLQLWDRPCIVFVTVCTNKRKPILAQADIFNLMSAVWRDSRDWLVGRFVIMPDHIHLFCSPARADSPQLYNWMRYWKFHATRRWPRPEERPIWQADYWDRQLRHGESYGNKWEYVRQNPVRHALVANPEDWPYQGELNELRWE